MEGHFEDLNWRKEPQHTRYKELMEIFLTILKNSSHFSNNSGFTNNFTVLLDTLIKLLYKISNNGFGNDVNNLIIIFKNHNHNK